MKEKIINIPYLRCCAYLFLAFKEDFFYNPFRLLKNMTWYFSDLIRFRSGKNPNCKIDNTKLSPIIRDKTLSTPVDNIYLLQDAWACRHIFKYKPKSHYDIGSFVKTVAIISQFVPTIFIDIRPISTVLRNLKFITGSILQIPLKNNSVESISSMCVIEHIGLGRYGDPLDVWGTEKAAIELQRVLQKNGHLLISVPVENRSSVYFNAHRVFSRKYILHLFNQCKLSDEGYIYGSEITAKFDSNRSGVGLFHFIKE